MDLDGTLLDTADDFVWAMNQLLEQEGRPPISRQVLVPHISTGARGMVCATLGITPQSPRYQKYFESMLKLYRQTLGARSRLFPGVRAVIKRVKNMDLKWGIVTNKYARFSEPLLRQLKLDPDVLVCPDHVDNAKPAPDAVLHACAQLGCEAHRALFVGDHERDILSGKRAGSVTAVASWGYADNEQASSWEADYVLEDTRDLDALVAKLGARA